MIDSKASAERDDPQIVRLREAVRLVYMRQRAEADQRSAAPAPAYNPAVAMYTPAGTRAPAPGAAAGGDEVDYAAFGVGLQAGVNEVVSAEVDAMREDLNRSVGALALDPVRGSTALLSPLARTVVAPLDLVMTRRQVTTKVSIAPYAPLPVANIGAGAAKLKLDAALKSAHIRNTEGGWKAMYKGNGLNALAGFGRYFLCGLAFRAAEAGEWFGKQKDVSSPEQTPSLAHSLYVGAAYTASRAALYPVEMARTLRQCDAHVIGQPYAPMSAGATAGAAFPSVRDTLKASNFRGFGPVAVSEMAFGSAVVYGYPLVIALTDDKRKASPDDAGKGAALAAGMGAILAVHYPLETLSKRMRVSGVGPFPRYGSVMECYRQTGGFAGQYRGVGLMLAKCVPLGAIGLLGLFGYTAYANGVVTKKLDALDFNLLTKTWDNDYRTAKAKAQADARTSVAALSGVGAVSVGPRTFVPPPVGAAASAAAGARKN